MEESFRRWDTENKAKRDEYWRRLRLAFKDYENSDHGPYGEPNFASFKYFMERRYGMRVDMTGSNIAGTYQVIDEKKYSLFLLKYA
jgi:hypothetical protein